MGTSNFYNKNASKVFAVLMNYETPILDDDGNETEETETVSPEDFECDDLIEDVQNHLKESKFYSWIPSKPVWDNDRNYSGRKIGSLSVGKQYGGVSIDIGIEAILRSAYYEGANLDWELIITIDGADTDFEDFLQDFSYASEMSVGLCTIVSRKALKWAEKMQNELIKEIEKIYTEISMPLQVMARFSNGETMYTKA